MLYVNKYRYALMQGLEVSIFHVTSSVTEVGSICGGEGKERMEPQGQLLGTLSHRAAAIGLSVAAACALCTQEAAITATAAVFSSITYSRSSIGVSSSSCFPVQRSWAGKTPHHSTG